MRPDSRFPYALRRRSALLLCTLLATFASVLTAGCKDVPPAARVVAAASAGFDAGVLYPTSAVYDPRANVLLIGSYADGSIQRVSAMEDAPRARLAGLPLDGRQHVLRIRIDATRHRIWVLSSDGLYLYDGESLKLTHRVATEALSQHSSEHCLPDMALDRSGNVYVSSAMEPRYMRVDAESLDVRQHVVQVDSEQGKDFGFSAMRFAGEDDTLYAASATIGTLWKIDPRKNHATKIALTQPIWGACALHAAPTGENGSGSRAPSRSTWLVVFATVSHASKSRDRTCHRR